MGRASEGDRRRLIGGRGDGLGKTTRLVRRSPVDRDRETDLTGQVAVVTGGGRGIGRTIALGLARAGASVAVVARSEGQITAVADQIAEAGGQSLAIPADVAQPVDVDRMIGAVERTLGPVD